MSFINDLLTTRMCDICGDIREGESGDLCPDDWRFCYLKANIDEGCRHFCEKCWMTNKRALDILKFCNAYRV